MISRRAAPDGARSSSTLFHAHLTLHASIQKPLPKASPNGRGLIDTFKRLRTVADGCGHESNVSLPLGPQGSTRTLRNLRYAVGTKTLIAKPLPRGLNCMKRLPKYQCLYQDTRTRGVLFLLWVLVVNSIVPQILRRPGLSRVRFRFWSARGRVGQTTRIMLGAMRSRLAQVSISTCSDLSRPPRPSF